MAKLRKGDKVKVFSADQKRYLGVWIYSHSTDYYGFYTPVFAQGKKRIHGYSCWWIFLKDAIAAELAAKEGKR